MICKSRNFDYRHNLCFSCPRRKPRFVGMERLRILNKFTILLLTAFLLVAGSERGWTQTTNVWPGDVNENGVVNHVDLLYLGLRLGSQGPARDSISIQWIGHSATRWNPTVNILPDPVHADCNGDSTVELMDRVAIDLNYGWDKGFMLPDSSSLRSSGTSAAPLNFEFSSNPLVAGTTDTIFFDLGSADQPVDSLLGFAATLSLDSTLVDTAYLWMGDSWLGTEGLDMATIDHYEPGKLEIGATRTDSTDVLQGQGRLGGVVVVMADNLKREVQVDSMGFKFEDALGLTSRFGIADFSVSPSTAKVFSSSEPLDALVYPNPTTAGVNIMLISPLEGEASGKLYDLQGRVVREFTVSNVVLHLERAGIQSGIYLLHLRRGDSHMRKRILFTE